MNKTATSFLKSALALTVIAQPLTACGTATEPAVSTELVPSPIYTNIGRQIAEPEGERLMGLHVVVFEPRGDCLAVLYDGSIYDPVFGVDDPAALAFASDHLDWNDERFDFGKGVYAPGLIKSSGALKGGCYDRALLIGALSNE